MNNPDGKKKKWLQFRLAASVGFVGLPNRLVDGKAFTAMTTGASVKTLVWFWQMAEYDRKAKKAGTESPVGRTDKIKNNGELSFTYQEAGWRGMNARRFSRALKELYRLGFIDISHLGRGIRGDYTRYAISDRWRKYDTPEWKEHPYPGNWEEGFRSEKYRQPKEENNGQKHPLPTDDKVRYTPKKSPHNGRKRPLKVAESSNSQRTKTSVSIDSAMPLKTPKGFKEKGSAPDSRSKGTAAPNSAITCFTKPGDLPGEAAR